MAQVVRVAAIQASPAIFDAAASVEKAISLLEKAAAESVQLAVLPESFLAGYPIGEMGAEVVRWTPAGDALYAAMYASAIEVPGPETQRLAEACERLGIYCAVGVNERVPSESSSLYNTLLLFGPSGLLHAHRKVMPTNQERMFYMAGDGTDIAVVQTEIGRLGGLICWENFMPLARYALEKQAPQLWVAPNAGSEEEWIAFMRAVAMESGAFVITSPFYARPTDYPHDFPIDPPDDEYDGGAAIIAPGGEVIAGPLRGEEGMVVADCDLERIVTWRRGFDVTGHYSRDDVLIPAILDPPLHSG